MWLLVVACSGGRGGGEPHRPHGGSATPEAPIAETGPSQKDCEALIAHVSALGAGEVKSDPPPTADDRSVVAIDMAPHIPGCLKSTRAGYRCAMAAKSLAEVANCRAK